MSYPQPINFSDIAVGMFVRQVNTWTDGSTLTLISYVTGKSETAVTYAASDLMSPPPEAWNPPGAASLTYELMQAPPTLPTEPGMGGVRKDETGTVWQRTGTDATTAWTSTTGQAMSWEALNRAHTLSAVTA